MTIQFFSQSNTFLDIVLPILIALSTINIGLIAFVYPKIFETTRSLKDISQIFVKKLQRKFYLCYYLGFITFCITINLISIGFCVFNSNYLDIILILNFIITLVGIFGSYFVFKLLTTYYNYTEELFNVAKINLTANNKNEDLELLQITAIHSIKNQYDLYFFEKALALIDQIFRKNILQNIKKLKESDFLGLSSENDYLFRPLEILTYIFQRSVDGNKQEISNQILNTLLEMLNDSLLKWEHTPAFKLELKIINTFIQNMKYKINRGKIYNDDIIFISHFYFILCEYYKNILPNITDSINTSLLKPNEKIFPLFQSLINNNASIELLQSWQDSIKSYIHSDKISRTKILQLNSQIISYLIFKEKYKDAYEYMYYETPKENHSEYTFPQMPRYLSEIFNCYIGKGSAFLQNQTFDKNQQSEKYKFFTLFLFLCSAKDRYDNLKKQKIHDWRNEFIKNNIERYTQITKTFIDGLTNEELFFNYFNNQKKILKNLNEFYNNHALITTFQIDEKYKNFIKSKIKILQEKIIIKRTPILEKPLSQDLIAQIKKESHDIYEALTPNWFIDKIFETKKEKKKFFLNLYNFLYQRKAKTTTAFPLGDITVTQEKGRLLVYDNLEQRIFNFLSQQTYRQLFNQLQTVLEPITSITELNSIKLNNYCIITNFSASQNILLKVFAKENICSKNSYISANYIKIGKQNIPIILRDYLFHENFCKTPTILFIDRSKINLKKTLCQEISIKEYRLDKGKIFDDLFNPDYSTDAEIAITLPSFIEIIYSGKNIGYKLEISDKNI